MATRDRRSPRPAFVTPAQVDLRRPHPLDPAASDPPVRLVGEPSEGAVEEAPAGAAQPGTSEQPPSGGGEPLGGADSTATAAPQPEPQQALSGAPDRADTSTDPGGPALSVVAPAADEEAVQVEPVPAAPAAAKLRTRKRAASASTTPPQPQPEPEPEPEVEVVEPLVALGTRIPRSMLKRLKVAAVLQDKTVQDAVTEAVKKWLDEAEA